MLDICSEDECNDTYGRIRMYQALQLKQPEGVHIPGERTVYRVMAEIGLNHKPKRKPNGITKADREAVKSDDLIKRDFAAEKPLEKCMTDMTEIKASDGNSMFQLSLTAMIPHIGTCYGYKYESYPMRTNLRECLKLTRCSVELFFTVTGEPSIPLSYIVKLSTDMALFKA